MKNHFNPSLNINTLLNAVRSLLLVLTLIAVQAQAGVVAITNNINLIQCWNLVGNSVEAPITVASSFSDTSKVITIWKWVSTGSTAGIS